jgi:EAL domain-containing protein (putative c-di-GMP-specific phosphodiesterase class I)
MNAEIPYSAYGPFDARLPDLILDALAGDPAAAGFDVHYQPIVRLDDTEVVAAEALVRWRHPTAGDVPASVFVALAERAGLIGVLDDFVLNRACADATALARAYGHEIDVHVNVSASRLGRADLEATLTWALRRHQFAPGRLVLEVTEVGRVADLDMAATAIRSIRDRGVSIALDDFGTAFNMLAQLRALAVDAVKLDTLLISSDEDIWRTEALCRSVLAGCKEISVKVIADGVERVAQVRALQGMQCQLGQGPLYGSALPLTQLAANQKRRRLRATDLLGTTAKVRTIGGEKSDRLV